MKRPTIVGAEDFNSKTDCEGLMKAMKGIGTNDEALIAIVTKRSNEQRLEMIKTYKEMYKKDLVAEIKSETSGNYLKALQALMMNPMELLAREINRCIAKKDTLSVIEIIYVQSCQKLPLLLSEYEKLFGDKSFDKELAKNFKQNQVEMKIIEGIAKRTKQNTKTDVELAKQSAVAFSSLLKDSKNIDEINDKLLDLFTKNGKSQIRLFLECYEEESKRIFEKDLAIALEKSKNSLQIWLDLGNFLLV